MNPGIIDLCNSCGSWVLLQIDVSKRKFFRKRPLSQELPYIKLLFKIMHCITLETYCEIILFTPFYKTMKIDLFLESNDQWGSTHLKVFFTSYQRPTFFIYSKAANTIILGGGWQFYSLLYIACLFVAHCVLLLLYMVYSNQTPWCIKHCRRATHELLVWTLHRTWDEYNVNGLYHTCNVISMAWEVNLVLLILDTKRELFRRVDFLVIR